MKLLIVEDSALVTDRLCQTLAGIPALNVSQAASLAAARESLRNWQPHTVILDIVLGDGNGLDLLRSIKREWPKICVLMFSNHTDFRQLCTKAGADAFFDKAMEFEALASTVRSLADVTA